MVLNTPSEKDIAGYGDDHATQSPQFSSKASSDVDENYHIYTNYSGSEVVDAAESKSVLRKIDLRLIPALWLLYLLQYLDKNGINYASVYGLQKGTNLHGDQYSWLSSIFYFGYLAGQYPSGYLMQKLPIGKVISCTAMAWSVVLLTTPACSSFAGMAVNRFLLGFLEAAVNPGFVLLMGMWYVSSEQPLRLESYYCTNGIATMFGGLVGYAIGHINGALEQWKYVFLIFGAVSFAGGFYALLVLPDLPSTAKFLTERERFVVVQRVAANRQGVKNSTFKAHQVKQTFLDPKTWLLFVMAVGAQVPNSALTSFTSIIIKSFGFDTLGTQYLQIPGGAVQFLSLLGGGIICSRWPNIRCPTMIVANSICIIGSGLLVGLPAGNKWGRLVAIWLCYFQGLGFSMSLTMISSNVAGFTKKQLTSVILFVGYCVGNIIGPQTFKSGEAPGYHSAYIAYVLNHPRSPPYRLR